MFVDAHGGESYGGIPGEFLTQQALLESGEGSAVPLGFEQVMGNEADHWLILRNGETTIGLFQGMFDKNTLTFNPGWSPQAEKLDEFEDVREIQRHLKASGLTLTHEADESTSGPASLMLFDPDGNPVLIDQHV